MRKIILIIFLIMILAGQIMAAPSQQVKPGSAEAKPAPLYSGEFTYIIGVGDFLEITVWRHTDLNTKAVVRPDGKIAFPLIEELAVCNLTPSGLKDEIAKRLSKTIRDPQVTVNILGFESKKFFVLGEVKNPGVYPLEGKFDVLEGISRAGSYKDDTANLKSVILIRRAYAAKPEAKRLNIYEVIKNADFSQNIPLEAGDIIFVPKTFISEVNKFIDIFLTKTDPAIQYYLDIMDVKHGGRNRYENNSWW